MTGPYTFPDHLQFLCPTCRAQLSVPANLAGVEGPCPNCYHTIRAPIPEALYAPAPAAPPPLAAPMVQPMPVSFPPLREADLQAIPQQPRSAPADPEFSLVPTERNFKARLAIPAQDEPLDDSWKERHRNQRKQNRRARKAEETAQSFLESRGFQLARVALIMLSGAMLVWLYQYLKHHQWRLPGMSPAVAEKKEGGTGHVKPVGSNPNELMADDDAEIPPASNRQPEQTAPAGTPAQPVAGRTTP
jgi:hypothetical protein